MVRIVRVEVLSVTPLAAHARSPLDNSAIQAGALEHPLILVVSIDEWLGHPAHARDRVDIFLRGPHRFSSRHSQLMQASLEVS